MPLFIIFGRYQREKRSNIKNQIFIIFLELQKISMQ